MGLDQNILRISKPMLEDKVYTIQELNQMNLLVIPARDFEINTNLYQQLKPYAEKRDVIRELYDIEKMIADYNLPQNARPWHFFNGGIEISGYTEDGEYVNKQISQDEIEKKYTKMETTPHYITNREEVWYWRKNYDLAEWLSDNMKQPPENTGYYKLTKTLIKRINSKFKAKIPEESATKESALFYWEWY